MTFDIITDKIRPSEHPKPQGYLDRMSKNRSVRNYQKQSVKMFNDIVSGRKRERVERQQITESIKSELREMFAEFQD